VQAAQNGLQMKTPEKTLGQQAREFREAQGWNTTRMGEALSTSRQNIESLEKEGNRIPKYIGDLAFLMGTTVDEMLLKAGLTKQARVVTTWPFQSLDYEKIMRLDPASLSKLEGAIVASAHHLKLDIATGENTASESATGSGKSTGSSRRAA
jgi:DNA-binding XRE family transcriptional regulator